MWQSDGAVKKTNDWDLLVELGVKAIPGGNYMSEASRSLESLVSVEPGGNYMPEASRSLESLASASTEASTVTVVTRGILELTLPELCDLITEHISLQRAEIISTEVYTEPTKVWGHRFTILELLRTHRKTLYLRLDRRRVRKAVALGFLGRRTILSDDTVGSLHISKHTV